MKLAIADRLELHELAARYGTSIDDRDWDGLEDVFCRDAVYELRGFGEVDQRIVGAAAIRQMMEHSDGHPVAHHVTNVIVIAGDEEVRMRSKVIGSGAHGRVGSADYDDVVRHDDGVWRIAQRIVTLRR